MTTASLTVAGFIFGMVLWLVALFCAGGGHGTYLPLGIFGAPLSFVPVIGIVGPPVVWTAIGFVLGNAPKREARITAVGVQALSAAAVVFAGTPFEGATEQWSYLAGASRQIGPIIIGGVVIYGLGVAVAGYAALRAPGTGTPR